MDDPRDTIVNIARKISQHPCVSEIAGHLHEQLVVALDELDADHPFECELCGVRFMTKPELDDHFYSAQHIRQLNHSSPYSLCSG